MILQARYVQEWCAREGFQFVDCDAAGMKVPCSLDKDYVPEDQTYFISGFSPGSKAVTLSYGGMKQEIKLRVPIDSIPRDWIEKNWLSQDHYCARCGKKSLCLRTDDGHKTYVCPQCHRGDKA